MHIPHCKGKDINPTEVLLQVLPLKGRCNFLLVWQHLCDNAAQPVDSLVICLLLHPSPSNESLNLRLRIKESCVGEPETVSLQNIGRTWG